MCLGTHNLGIQKEPVLLLYWQKTGSSNFVFCLYLYFVCLLFPAFSVFISPQAFTYFKYNINAMVCSNSACYFNLLYSSSVTDSHHSFEVSSPGTSTARWLNQLSGAAPCQCFTSAGMLMQSPGFISTASLPSS